MTRFADPVRLAGIGKLVPGDRGRPNGTRFKKSYYSLEMSAIANDVGT
jgi:hypothetical protein